jgi:anti-sigma factor RsiW
MKCPLGNRKPETLIAYAAGELEVPAAALIERHLSECTGCRSLVAEHMALWKVLDIWEAPPISDDFDRRLYRRIAGDVTLSWWRRLARPLQSMPLRQVLPLAATACLLVIATFLVRQPDQLSPARVGGEVVRADQVERTLEDLELLRQFGTSSQTEPPHSDTM